MLGAVIIVTALRRSVSFCCSKHESLLICGSKHLSASTVPHSLGTFLAEQESTAPGRVNNFVSYIIYYFSQKEKRVTKNLHLGLLFGNFYDNI